MVVFCVSMLDTGIIVCHGVGVSSAGWQPWCCPVLVEQATEGGYKGYLRSAVTDS